MSPGEYEIVVNNPNSGLVFSTLKFAIARNDVTLVDVTLQETMSQELSVATKSPDRRAAEWVWAIGGGLHLKMASGASVKVKDKLPPQLPIEPFHVVAVDIGMLPSVTDEGLKNLRGLSHLTDFTAWNTAITDQGLANMTDEGRQPLRELRGVELQRTQVTNTGLRYLVGSEKLENLKIPDTKVSDANVLLSFPKLSVLSVSTTEISGEALVVLKELASLTSLIVDGTQLEEGGDRHVGSLEQLTSLHIVDAQRLDSSVLNSLNNITKLSVSTSEIDELFWSTLRDMPRLEVLQITSTSVTTSSIGKMETLPQLRTLWLQSAQLSGRAIVDAASRHPQLTELQMAYCPLTDADVKELESLKKLSLLDLSGSPQVTAAAINSLRKALANCEIISDHGKFAPKSDPHREVARWVQSIAGLVKARTEDGTNVDITKDMELPSQAFSALSIIIPPNAMPKVTDGDLAKLVVCKQLSWLTITNHPVADDGMKHLGQITTLQHLLLQGCLVTDEGLKHLTQLRNLKVLDLARTKVTAAGVNSLHESLPNCKITSDHGTFEPISGGPSKSSDVTAIFNGRDLSGWLPMSTAESGAHSPTSGGWNATDGQLICDTKESGWLRFQAQLQNFELELEFQIPAGGNSGILIRHSGEGVLGHEGGMEIQIEDDPSQRKPQQKIGSIYGRVPSQGSKLRRDAWNEIKILCLGERVAVTLNGVQVVDAKMDEHPALKDLPRRGFIGIYNYRGDAHGAMFRNLRLRKLPDDSGADGELAP